MAVVMIRWVVEATTVATAAIWTTCTAPSICRYEALWLCVACPHGRSLDCCHHACTDETFLGTAFLRDTCGLSAADLALTRFLRFNDALLERGYELRMTPRIRLYIYLTNVFTYVFT